MANALTLGIVAAISAFLLRGMGWKGVPVFISVTFIGIISLAAPYLIEMSKFVKTVAADYAAFDAASAILKVVGLGYLTGIAADVCRELESGMLASAVVLVGRIEIIAVALPFFREIVDLGGELLG